jgi:hypothetical protein
MTTLRLPGQPVGNDARDLDVLQPFLDVEVLRTHEVIGVVRGAALKSADLQGAKDDDIIELQFDGGVVQWTTVAQLKDEGRVARGADDDVLEVPVQFRRGAAERGLWDWILRGLRVLRVDPANKLADLGQVEIVDRFEGQQQPPPGLYRVGDKGVLTETITALGQLSGGSAPWLILIHGTASSTDGSYGKMFETQEFRDLRSRYGDRILALQHKTLSVSPATNAIDLATLLPANTVVHLVTHSRGGLIGELLCIETFDDASLDVFRKAARNADIKQLTDLRTLLTEKKLTVEKFVRVACPARGTILASRRLDLYFSVILNLLGRLMPDNPLYALFKATALALIKRRTMADQLPGLEAQMPESPYVHFLNKGLATQADLGVIAGDLEGDSFFSRLKVFATDIFYLQEHDLVVNTSSMFGGMGRPAGARGFYDQGATVNHFSYFGNQKTRARLYGWLTAPKGTPDPAFREFDPRVGGIPIDPARAARAKADSTRPAAIIVPDVFGTLLERAGETVWPDVTAIARHGLSTLDITNALTPGTLVKRVYGPLVSGLSSDAEVVPFAYDWRQSITNAAAELANVIDGVGDRVVHIVAHGSGGLVVRALVQGHEKAWTRVTKSRGRVLLLGAPLAGTFAAVQWCSGRSKLARILALADGSASQAVANGNQVAGHVGAWFRSLPGIVELVPERYLIPKTWQDDGTPSPDATMLANAAALRAQLASIALPKNVITVVGRDATTPVAFDVSALNVLITRDGDGRVALDSAIAPQVSAWRVETTHGELAAYAGAFTAYAELLRTGETSRLRHPQGLSTTTEPIRSDANDPLLFPTSEDLASEAFALREAIGEQRDYPLTVSVTHGDLRMVRYPVIVGHYQGDSIVSAEAVLDRRLEMRLSHRFQMGLYPGPAGTIEVIRSPKSRPPGAIIIGLGHVGSVTPEIIRRGVAAAALRYALQIVEEGEGGGETGAETWRSAALSAVLVGTNGGNAISIEESIAAVVRGAIDANRTLRRQKQWDDVRIDAIEFVELYEQRAIESVYAAQHAVKRMVPQLEKGERVDVIPILRPMEGGQFRTPPPAIQTGWWQRMFITAADGVNTGAPGNVPLKYVVIGERARAEATLQCREQNVIQMLIEGAVTKPAFDEALSGALFELLVPAEIKGAAANVPSVVITLDRNAAQIPWEILSDPMAGEKKPFSVRAGLLRQLMGDEYRIDPRSAELRTALVVGDTTSGLAQLRGAQEEAEAVAKVIGDSKFEVTALLRPDPMTLITELFARPYRILHLAGHGSYNAANPSESGMVLDARQNIFLTACQLRQLRTVPDFVFINCCFLGKIDETSRPQLQELRPHLMAASIAEELIRMGVKAVIAAGWAVDDAAAVTFASTFYDAMLRERRPFGDAVRSAREQVFASHPSTNTWGAYQCYGNPGFVLAGIDGTAPPPELEEFCSKREYVDAVRSLAAQADVEDDRPYVLESLTKFGGRLPERWLDGEMLAQLGNAWRSVNDLDAAIASLDRALGHQRASAPISAAEQLWNAVCRRALELHAAGIDPKRVEELLKREEELRRWLAVLPPSEERLRWHGTNYRRLSRIAVDRRESDRLLKLAAAAFHASAEARDRADGPAQYQILNYILIDWLLDPARTDVVKRLDDIEPAVNANAEVESFWDRIGVADLALLRGLLAGKVDAARIAALYAHAVDTPTATAREKKATAEYLAWIADELKRRKHTLPRGLEDLLQMANTPQGVSAKGAGRRRTVNRSRK